MLGTPGRVAAYLFVLVAASGLLVGGDASAASIRFSGSITGYDASGPIIAYQPFTIRATNSLDNGLAFGNVVDGFPSLAGLAPGSLRLAFGDLELISTTFTPGCRPFPGVNCPSVTNTYGNADTTPAFFDMTLNGTTILSGTISTWSSFLDTRAPNNPNFGHGTGAGMMQLTSGLAPYFDEAMAYTGGTGQIQVVGEEFNAVCQFGSDCRYNLSATLNFVPEPTTALLLGLGLAALSRSRRLRY